MGAVQSRVECAGGAELPSGHPPTDGSAGDAAKCPVNHDALAKIALSAKAQQEKSGTAPADASKCPVDHGASKTFAQKASELPAPAKAAPAGKAAQGAKPEVYNVYGQRIDPDNMMPANPNQLPTAGQDAPLSQARVQSSIPKGGTDSTWTYPSPQIFYNSLTRKGKRDGVSARDVELVVAIHNNMNEHGWKEVMRWEALHSADCEQPKLLRFTGKPKDLSPLARIRSWLGYGLPFDRHDWIVDRNGKQVRYILDYYHYEDPNKLASLGLRAGASKDGETESRIVLDVRPALDSGEAFIDRARVWFGRRMGLTPHRVGGFSAPPDVIHEPLTKELSAQEPPSRLKVSDKEEFERLSSLTADRVRSLGVEFDKKCNQSMAALQKASSQGGDKEIRMAHSALRLCMSDIVCPTQSKLLRSLMDKRNVSSEQFDNAYEEMDSCVERFTLAAARELANEETSAIRKSSKETHSSDEIQ